MTIIEMISLRDVLTEAMAECGNYDYSSNAIVVALQSAIDEVFP